MIKLFKLYFFSLSVAAILSHAAFAASNNSTGITSFNSGNSAPPNISGTTSNTIGGVNAAVTNQTAVGSNNSSANSSANNSALNSQSPSNPIVEFKLINGRVTYQLNRFTNSLIGIIPASQANPICVHSLNFKSKSGANVWLYENNSTERNQRHYERFELNLDSSEVRIYSSIRNFVTSIPVSKKECSSSACINVRALPACNFN